jgi:hypothetical protein
MADAQSLQKELDLLKLRTQIAEERKKLEAARKSEPEPPADPELEEAKRAAALAEELKKARTALPEPEAKALEGKLTIDDKVTIESQTLAYASMAKIAAQIAKEVKEIRAPRVVIYHDKDMASLLELRTFLAQAKSIQQAFEDATPKPAPSDRRGASFESIIATGALAVTAAKTLVDLVALFRTDTAITGVEVTLDDTALAASVAHSLGGVVFYPQIQPLDFSSHAAFTKSEVVAVLDGLHKARQEAEAAVKRATEALEADDDEARKTAADLLKEPLTKADALYQPFRDALFKADDTGANALGRLLRAEILASRLEENGSHLLYLKVVKAGGSNRITRNLFTGSKLWHSGGAIVTYLLFRPDGAIAASGTLYRHSGYKRFEAPDDLEFPLDNFSR